MNLRHDYLEKIKGLKKYSIYNNLIYINQNSLGNLYEDLTQINFIALYPNILVGLFKNGLIDEKWKDDIERVKWFLNNRNELKTLNSYEYQKWKVHCNSLYAKIKSPYIVEYMNLFYSDLKDKYGDKIIYFDVDLLIVNFTKVEFQTKYQIEELNDFDHSITFINYFYGEALKKYVKQDETGSMSVVGFKNEARYNIDALIKREIRRRKLDILGI